MNLGQGHDELRARAAQALGRYQHGNRGALAIFGVNRLSSHDVAGNVVRALFPAIDFDNVDHTRNAAGDIVHSLFPRVDSVQSYLEQPVGTKLIDFDTGDIVVTEQIDLDVERDKKEIYKLVYPIVSNRILYAVWSPS